MFTGLSLLLCARAWWHLIIFRFLAALGVGGEWAVGASLLSETWPSKWRPWIAAVLQSGVNVGILGAALANLVLASRPPNYLFLVGVLPALLVLWIRRAVPETEGMAFGPGAGARLQAGCPRPLCRGCPAHHGVGHPRVRRVAHRALGVYLLEPATIAKPARRAEHEPGRQEPPGQPVTLRHHRRIHCREFLRGLARANHRLPRHNRCHVSRLFPRDDRRVRHRPRPYRPALLVPADWLLPGSFCAFHDVLCRRRFPLCFEPPALGFATTSDASLRQSAPLYSAFPRT